MRPIKVKPKKKKKGKKGPHFKKQKETKKRETFRVNIKS